MTNANVPANLTAVNSGSTGELVEDIYPSRIDGEDISFPKFRTAVIEEGAKSITFEVDFNKLKNQQQLYTLNAAK